MLLQDNMRDIFMLRGELMQTFFIIAKIMQLEKNKDP